MIGFTLGRPSSRSCPAPRRRRRDIYTGQLGPGARVVTVRTVNGVRVPDGAYDLVNGERRAAVTLSAPVTIDATAPA